MQTQTGGNTLRLNLHFYENFHDFADHVVQKEYLHFVSDKDCLYGSLVGVFIRTDERVRWCIRSTFYERRESRIEQNLLLGTRPADRQFTFELNAFLNFSYICLGEKDLSRTDVVGFLANAG